MLNNRSAVCFVSTSLTFFVLFLPVYALFLLGSDLRAHCETRRKMNQCKIGNEQEDGEEDNRLGQHRNTRMQEQNEHNREFLSFIFQHWHAITIDLLLNVAFPSLTLSLSHQLSIKVSFLRPESNCFPP